MSSTLSYLMTKAVLIARCEGFEALAEWAVGGRFVVGMKERLNDNKHLVTKHVTRSFSVGFCSGRVLDLTTGRDKFDRGFFRHGSRRGNFVGILFDPFTPLVNGNSPCTGRLDSRSLFGFRDSTVHGTTARRSYIFIKHYTSCVLHSFPGYIGVFVATSVPSHVGQLDGLLNVDRGRTRGHYLSKSRGHTGCCGCCYTGA